MLIISLYYYYYIIISLYKYNSLPVSLYQQRRDPKQYSGRHSVSGHFNRDATSLLPSKTHPHPPAMMLRRVTWGARGCLRWRRGRCCCWCGGRASSLHCSPRTCWLSLPGKKGGAWWPEEEGQQCEQLSIGLSAHAAWTLHTCTLYVKRCCWFES